MQVLHSTPYMRTNLKSGGGIISKDMRNAYQRLKEIKDQYPELTFQNEGYQYLPKEVRERHAEQIEEISSILRQTIVGFIEFNNFKTHEDGTVTVRVQFNWEAEKDNSNVGYFAGVGYFDLELFRNETYKIETA